MRDKRLYEDEKDRFKEAVSAAEVRVIGRVMPFIKGEERRILRFVRTMAAIMAIMVISILVVVTAVSYQVKSIREASEKELQALKNRVEIVERALRKAKEP